MVGCLLNVVIFRVRVIRGEFIMISSKKIYIIIRPIEYCHIRWIIDLSGVLCPSRFWIMIYTSWRQYDTNYAKWTCSERVTAKIRQKNYEIHILFMGQHRRQWMPFFVSAGAPNSYWGAVNTQLHSPTDIDALSNRYTFNRNYNGVGSTIMLPYNAPIMHI